MEIAGPWTQQAGCVQIRWSDLQLEFDFTGAVVSHKAFECVPECDAGMRDVAVERSPFICYGLLDFESLPLRFFCRSFDDNGINIVGIAADFFVPAVSIASIFELITEIVVGKIAVHI